MFFVIAVVLGKNSTLTLRITVPETIHKFSDCPKIKKNSCNDTLQVLNDIQHLLTFNYVSTEPMHSHALLLNNKILVTKADTNWISFCNYILNFESKYYKPWNFDQASVSYLLANSLKRIASGQIISMPSFMSSQIAFSCFSGFKSSTITRTVGPQWRCTDNALTTWAASSASGSYKVIHSLALKWLLVCAMMRFQRTHVYISWLISHLRNDSHIAEHNSHNLTRHNYMASGMKWIKRKLLEITYINSEII